MIALRQVTFARAGRPLVIDASVQMHPGWKVGVVGANGCGKSSLFALLANELHAESGNVEIPASWHIARVAQETPALPDSAPRFRPRRRRRTAPHRARTGRSRSQRRRRRHRPPARPLRRNRRLFGQGPRRRSAARPRLHRRRFRAFGRRILRRLARPPQPRPRPVLPRRPAAARRADQPPRPRRRLLARKLAQEHAGDAAPDLPRPRLPRRRRRPDHRHRPPAPDADQRRLQRLRTRPRRPPRHPAIVLRSPAARNRPPVELHRTLQGQGHQGPPGAKPDQDARTHGNGRRRPRRLALPFRLPPADRPARPAADHRKSLGRLRRSQDHRPRHADPAPRLPHRPARPQRRRQIDADQAAGQLHRPARRRAQGSQGAQHRLLRPAPARTTAPRRIAAATPGAPRPDGHRTGTARLHRRLRFPRRHGDARHRTLLRRRKIAPGAGLADPHRGPTCCCSTNRPTTSTSKCAKP